MIPQNQKSPIVHSSHGRITLASSHVVNVLGTCHVTVRLVHGKYRLPVTVLEKCSFPMILGETYLRSKGIVLDYAAKHFQVTKCKVRTRQITVVPANSEAIIWAKIPRVMPVGVQGFCSNCSHILQCNLLTCKSLVTVNTTHLVPIKLLNPTNVPVTLCRNQIVAQFCMLNNTDKISPSPSTQAKSPPAQPTVCSVHGVPIPEPCSPNVGHQNSDEPVNGNTQEFLKHFDLSDTELSTEQKEALSHVLLANKDLFVTQHSTELGVTDMVQHRIHLKPNAAPKHQRPYRLPPDKREVLRHQLEELLKQGVIVPVDETEELPITSPIVLVSKRGKPNASVTAGSREASLSMYRFCCDFRFLNTQTQDFNYAIPDLQELTESFSHRKPNYISLFDLSSGFFQMKIAPESTKYTAFNTCFGTYKFQRLPQGLKTAPASFQMLMDKVLHGLSFQSILCYLDDCVLYSETFEQHLSDLSTVFDRFRRAGLRLNAKKCAFARSRCIFLGHEISADGISPPADRVKAILDYPAPRDAKETRRLMGLLNWFRKYIPSFSALAAPINKLLKRDIPFHWGADQDQALGELKSRLANSEVLAFPDFSLPFHLAVDTSSKGIGYMLYQVHPVTDSQGHESDKQQPRVIRFGSKTLTKWQSAYGPTKLELLGVVTSILDCASYLRGSKFVVECDHQALKPLFQNKLKGAIYERWLAILQQFNFEIRYKPAAEMVVPDALSRCCPLSHAQGPNSPVSSPEEDDRFFPYVSETVGQITFPVEDLPQSAETRPVVSSAQVQNDLIPPNVCRMARPHVDLHDEYDADTEAPFEYSLRRKRSKPKQSHKSRVLCSLDSAASGADSNAAITLPHSLDSPVTDTPLSMPQSSLPSLQGVSESSPEVSTAVSSDAAPSNSQAVDSSAIPPPDSLQDQIEAMALFDQSDISPGELAKLQQSDPTLRPLIVYLTDKTLPPSQKEARKLLLESADYHLLAGLLFHSRIARSKRTKQLGHYQLVIPQVMIKTVLQLYHDSPLGGHCGIQATLDRVREHYFFHSLASHVTKYVQSCPDCQKRKITQVHTKAGIVAYPSPSGPFQVWEVDLYGKLPPTPQGNSFILTAVDMFSKYVVAIPIANKDALTVATALFHLFCTYGVCHTLISDQGSEFTSKVTAELCRLLGISQQFTPSFVHHCLGACERTHATLATKLTPFMDNSKRNWQDVLPAVLFAMNSAVNTTLGYSPHEMVFGSRPMFPLSYPPVRLDTVPVSAHAFMQDKMALIAQISAHARSNLEKSQIRMIDRVNKDSHPLPLQVGDYVYLHQAPKGAGHKLQYMYKGPYVVSRLQSSHMVQLRNPESDKPLQNLVHINRLKMAYVRCPNPLPYFPDTVLTHIPPTADSDPSDSLPTAVPETADKPCTSHPPPLPPPLSPPAATSSRPQRTRKPPVRYGQPVPLDSTGSESPVYHHIKRVLAQRTGNSGTTEYLVHISGEPAQNAIWVPLSSLDAKAKQSVRVKPPPSV